MNLLYRSYYRLMAWKYGKTYGCGRCHHGYLFHRDHQNKDTPCSAPGCPCKAYHIGLTDSHASGGSDGG